MQNDKPQKKKKKKNAGERIRTRGCMKQVTLFSALLLGEVLRLVFCLEIKITGRKEHNALG